MKKGYDEVGRIQRWRRLTMCRDTLNKLLSENLDNIVEAEVGKRVHQELKNALHLAPLENVLFAIDIGLTDEQFERLHMHNQLFHNATCGVSTLKKLRSVEKLQIVETFGLKTEEGTTFLNIKTLIN